jgi:hypothetical protein
MLVVALGAGVGCGKTPPRQSLQGWILEESREVGPCWFRMDHAWLYHSSEWHLQTDVVLQNTGAENARCGFDMRAVSASGEAITHDVSEAVELPPGESRNISKTAIEANLTGIVGSASEDAWVYVRLTHGYWPIGESVELHATPARDRPPAGESWNPR